MCKNKIFPHLLFVDIVCAQMNSLVEPFLISRRKGIKGKMPSDKLKVAHISYIFCLIHGFEAGSLVRGKLASKLGISFNSVFFFFFFFFFFWGGGGGGGVTADCNISLDCK